MPGLMPTAYRMHYQVALGDFSQDLNSLGQGRVIDSEMLHGIEMETYSNTAVVHDRD